MIFPPVQEDGPPPWFGGSSPDAIGVAAKTIDKYLTWGEPPEQVAEVVRVREAAEEAPAARSPSASACTLRGPRARNTVPADAPQQPQLVWLSGP